MQIAVVNFFFLISWLYSCYESIRKELHYIHLFLVFLSLTLFLSLLTSQHRTTFEQQYLKNGKIKLYLCQSFFKEYLISFLRVLRLIDFAFVVLYLLMFKIWKKICSLKNKVFQIIGIIAMISNTIAVQIWKFKEKPILWDVLRDLVPFVQFKNVKNTHGGVLLLVKFLIENVNFNKKILEF